jgi:hypothetical protein
MHPPGRCWNAPGLLRKPYTSPEQNHADIL